jgi:hypothetical protein
VLFYLSVGKKLGNLLFRTKFALIKLDLNPHLLVKMNPDSEFHLIPFTSDLLLFVLRIFFVNIFFSIVVPIEIPTKLISVETLFVISFVVHWHSFYSNA